MAALASDWLRHFRLLLWNRWTEFDETWQEARSQRPLPSLCFSDRSEKQDGRPCLWLAETFSTSSLKPLNGIQQNLTGSKISTSSTKFVFFGPIGKTRWPPLPLIGWDIFDFFSETAERNSTKLDRKQDLNFLYQVCVFRADRKKQDGRPGLWLTETFSTSLLKSLKGIQRNLIGSKISTSSTKFVFFGAIGKTRWPPLPLIGRHILDFSSETAERNSTKPDRMQDLNVLYQACVFRADRKKKMAALASDWLRHFRLLLWNRWREFNETLIGSKISTSSTKFVFFGPFEKNKMAALTSDWLRHFWLLLWNRWTEFNEIWQEARSQRPLQSLCLIGLIGKTRWPPWSLIVWDIFDFFSETAEQNSMKVTGSKISTSSTKFVFFGPIGKTRWPPWPLIGWDIFDFFSETAEWNSTKTWHEVRSQRPLLSLCFEGRSEKQDGHPGFWFAESFSTWLHIVLRCTICGPLGLFFITLLKRFENENISLIIPSKRVEIQMQVILQSKNNISSNLANHWVYKRYFSFSTFDGASPRSKVKRSFLTRSLYSGERQWPFGPLVYLYM